MRSGKAVKNQAPVVIEGQWLACGSRAQWVVVDVEVVGLNLTVGITPWPSLQVRPRSRIWPGILAGLKIVGGRLPMAGVST